MNKEQEDLAVELLSEVWRSHRDPESPDYNACEKEDEACQWCVEALSVIEAAN
jgi:hypothetical protein